MTQTPNPGPGRGLHSAAWGAILSSVGGAALQLMGIILDSRVGEPFIQAGLIFGLLGMALSLGTLVIAIITARRYPTGPLQNVGCALPLPFLLFLPLCYYNALGYGLGGDMARSTFYRNLGTISLLLALVTVVGLIFAGGRSRDTK